MPNLFRWSVLTAFVVSLLTFVLNFLTPALGVRLIVSIVLTVASIVYFVRKFGVPDSAFRTGGIIGLAAMTGLLVVMTTDVLEYVLTLVLFVIAYFLGGLVAKYSVPGAEFRLPRRKRKQTPEEEGAPREERPREEPRGEIPESEV